MDNAHLPPELLADYAEGLLDPAARRAADGHLEACGECRRALAAARDYFADMAGLEPFKAPDRFLTRVHARIAGRSPWKRLLAALSSPRFLPVPLAGLAAVLAGVYLVMAPRLREEAAPAVAVSLAAPEAEKKEPTPEASKREEREREAAVEPPPPLAVAEPSAKSAARRAAPSRPGAGAGQAASSAPPPARPPLPSPLPGEPPEESPEAAPGGAPVGALARAFSKEDRDSDHEYAMDGEANAASGAAEASAEAYGNAAAKVSGEAAAKAKAGKKAAAPPPSTSAPPWAPVAYTLKRGSGAAGNRAAADAEPLKPLDPPAKAGDLGEGLSGLGARVLRFEGGAVDRYELELPAARLPHLEAFLRERGELIPSPEPQSAQSARSDKATSPTLRLTLRVQNTR